MPHFNLDTLDFSLPLNLGLLDLARAFGFRDDDGVGARVEGSLHQAFFDQRKQCLVDPFLTGLEFFPAELNWPGVKVAFQMGAP